MKQIHTRAVMVFSLLSGIAGCTASSTTASTRMMAAEPGRAQQGSTQIAATSDAAIRVAAPAARATPGVGTCSDPFALEMGQTVRGDTSRAQNHHAASCTYGEAPELVYRLSIPRRMQVTLASEQAFDGAIYVLHDCAAVDGEAGPLRPASPNNAHEVACNDDDQQNSSSRIVQVLDPGDYYVVVDGADDASGTFSLSATSREILSPEGRCQRAPTLTVGQPTQGDTTGELNGFQATCANHAPGPDRVYRFDVAQESRVQATLETPGYEGALYLRRACAEPSAEIACTDYTASPAVSRINTVLAPGAYAVFVDANDTAGGPFTLRLDTASAAGSGVAGDSCQDAQALAIRASTTTTVQGNLLAARDDVTTVCGAGRDTADLVYRVDVPALGPLKLWFSQMDESLQEAGGLTVQIVRACGETTASNSVACRAVVLGDPSPIEATLTPGTYYVVVEAARARAFGRFALNAWFEDSAEVERTCRNATLLTHGRTFTGTTANADIEQARCAITRMPENLYRFVLRRRQHVRLVATSTARPYEPALYLRAACTNEANARACAEGTRADADGDIDVDLDAGTYTVFVDGFSEGEAGPYRLRAYFSAARTAASASAPRPITSAP
ncbi:MAG: hypothetical protein Q8Q09_06645 [Deltaproteobacteria bacterium]|nr:hypothetical protein [Deltaproteobacteria bacterium]